MIQPTPIPALIDNYRRLRDVGEPIAEYGYSWQKIGFRVVLRPNGTPFAIEDARDTAGKKTVPTEMIVPGQSKPTGQGINPGFLWDNAQYMLGVKAEDPKPERTARAFAAFRDRHLGLADTIDDPGFTAVANFLESWDPADIEQVQGYELLAELGSGFGIFALLNDPTPVHDREAVRAYWQGQIDQAVEATADDLDADHTGQSLVSGRVAPLARLHEPKIKGVAGGQSSGGVLVGFNEDAYRSYGKDKSYNAPVAEDEAFEYCTALNRLLANRQHRAQLGDTTVVFWAERPTLVEFVAPSIFHDPDPVPSAAPDESTEPNNADDPQPAEDRAVRMRVANFLDALRRGVEPPDLENPETPFYVLGLSPNAARISVRFWLAGTVRQFADRLGQHLHDLTIVGEYPDRPLTLRRLIRETAREPKDIPPQLAGEIARAILTGQPYPRALLTAILRRTRTDQTINPPRAAILKAYLNRHARLTRNPKLETPVSLNPEHDSAAYHMGRLFATFEYAQANALGKLNRTLKDAYFATASATPATVFPRLIKLHQHHVEKAAATPSEGREKKMRTKRFFDSLVTDICGRLDRFPTHLTLEQQGLFQIGYYHQRQAFYTKSGANSESDSDAEASAAT